jgi:DNA-binding SARP family transcriptional activator
MDLRILGPLEAYDDDGRPVELGGRQQRLVLAVLLLHRNGVVSVDRLVDVIWGERPPANAARNVQVHVSRLRKAFENIRTRANGYVLELDAGAVDVDRFERLVEESRQEASKGELERARATLQEALALWRGRALADFAYDSFAQSEIARLEELRLGALEDEVDVELALGLEHEAIPAARALVAEHPLRERPRGQLMLGLYRSGRKAEALRVYDEARRALVEELGFEPGERLQALQRAVLTDDPSLSGPAGPRTLRPAAEPARALARRRDALLAVGGALVLGAALAVGIFELTRDRASAGLASVGPNTLAAIDPGTNRLVSEIPVGARPASVAEADGSLWVGAGFSGRSPSARL